MTVFLDIAARASIILIAALLTTVAMRHAAAATRHLAWTLAVVCVLLLPMLMIVLPDWHIVPATRQTDTVLHAAVIVGQRIAGDVVDRSDLNAHIAFGIWASIAGALLIRLFTGIQSVHRFARHARPADTRVRAMLADISAAAGVNTSIRPLVSSDITTPITWGGSRPLLLLPDDAGTWSDDRLRVVLLHEVVHIRRADWFTHALARVLAAFHWFNPLAWIAVRAMTRERERAVDDCVVSSGTSASTYAQHLLDLACGDALQPRWTIAPAMARRSELEGRLFALLTPHRRSAGPYAAPALTAAAIAAAGLVATAAPRAALPAPVEPRIVNAASVGSTAQADQIAADREEAAAQRANRRALLGALADPNEGVRESAAMALAVRSESEIVEPLLRALKDTSAQVREKAAMGLAFRAQPRVVDALLEAAADPDAQVREKAVLALSFSRDARAVAALTAAAQDPDAQVREKAVMGLSVNRR